MISRKKYIYIFSKKRATKTHIKSHDGAPQLKSVYKPLYPLFSYYRVISYLYHSYIYLPTIVFHSATFLATEYPAPHPAGGFLNPKLNAVYHMDSSVQVGSRATYWDEQRRFFMYYQAWFSHAG
jgi:hypothetical protein